MQELKFVIPLPPVTKKNHGRIVRNQTSGRMHVLPSEQFLNYQDMAGYYLPDRWQEHDKPCTVKAVFYMKEHRRVDLVNLLEALDDVLVHYKVLKDDNAYIIISHDGSRVKYDKVNPRTEVSIKWE